MTIYRVNCAELADEHSHVLGLVVKKWKAKKGEFAVPKYLTKDEVIKKIDDGDTFQTYAKGSTATVHIIHERCGKDCPKEVLRSTADGITADNLDYMKCPPSSH